MITFEENLYRCGCNKGECAKIGIQCVLTDSSKKDSQQLFNNRFILLQSIVKQHHLTTRHVVS